MDKNPQARAMAFKKCRGKLLKIKELKIHPDMPLNEVEFIIEALAVSKTDLDKSDFTKNVKGQRWYVEELIKFSALTVQEQLDAEYEDSFADTANEEEMLEALKALAA